MGAKKISNTTNSYEKISKIDGSHPLMDLSENIYVKYKVRKRNGAKLRYFNFHLAKEMGLIEDSHEAVMNEELSSSLIDSFALMIINEYDIENNRKFSDVKENEYMATRYLQLQHPCKRGTTSGDGRSIWNGTVKHKGKNLGHFKLWYRGNKTESCNCYTR